MLSKGKKSQTSKQNKTAIYIILKYKEICNCIFGTTYIFTYNMYETIRIKEAMDLKDSKERDMDMFGERKGRENKVFILQSQK